MRLNFQDDMRQLRFRDNLRWFLRNEAMLKLYKEQGHLDAQYILEIFNDVSATFAEARIDIFNEIVECYQAGGRKAPVYPDESGLKWGHIVEVVKLPPRLPLAAR